MDFFNLMKSWLGNTMFWLMPAVIEAVLRQNPAATHPGKAVVTPTQVFPHQKTLSRRGALIHFPPPTLFFTFRFMPRPRRKLNFPLKLDFTFSKLLAHSLTHSVSQESNSLLHDSVAIDGDTLPQLRNDDEMAPGLQLRWVSWVPWFENQPPRRWAILPMAGVFSSSSTHWGTVFFIFSWPSFEAPARGQSVTLLEQLVSSTRSHFPWLVGSHASAHWPPHQARYQAAQDSLSALHHTYMTRTSQS